MRDSESERAFNHQPLQCKRTLAGEASLGCFLGLEQIQRHAPQHGEVLRPVAAAHTASVLVERHVQRPVQFVLYALVAPHCIKQSTRIECLPKGQMRRFVSLSMYYLLFVID